MNLGSKAIISNLENCVGQTSIKPGTILHKVKEQLTPHLGFHGELIAQPYQLLIYEEGGMFKPHRDTLRGENNIATLVVTLPVCGGAKGGELILFHESITSNDGDTETVELLPLDESHNAEWCAFFTDVVHEVKPVTSGYRASLTFHLWTSDSYGEIPRSVKRAKTSPSSDVLSKLQMVVGRALPRWFEQNELTRRVSLILVLDHQYSRNTSRMNLRGNDRLLWDMVQSISASSGALEVNCTDLIVERFEKPDPDEDLDRCCIPVVNLDDDNHPRNTNQENYIWLNRKRFLNLEHDIFSYSYDTGNEGETAGLSYKPWCITIRHIDCDEDDY
jgi:hypothetical protein